MNDDLFLTLLSSAPSIPGLWILHRAFRTRSVERQEMGSWKGIALVLAGLVLVAIPLAVWCGALFHRRQMDAHPVSPASVFLLAGYLDAIFFWFLWNLNALVGPEMRSWENPWEEHWGASYSPELKRRLLGSVLEQLDREGKIGNLIVDVGSGANPVSKFLPSMPDRRYILIDIARRNCQTPESQSIRGDAAKVTRPDLLSWKKAMVRVCRFLGQDPQAPAPERSATTMVFSDILNYVDFRKVIGCFSDFLKPGGRIIIVNLPGRGIREQFSEHGLKDNGELYPFLQERNLAIESKDFPCRPRDGTDESGEMIVLVARKAGGPVLDVGKVILPEIAGPSLGSPAG